MKKVIGEHTIFDGAIVNHTPDKYKCSGFVPDKLLTENLTEYLLAFVRSVEHSWANIRGVKETTGKILHVVASRKSASCLSRVLGALTLSHTQKAN